MVSAPACAANSVTHQRIIAIDLCSVFMFELDEYGRRDMNYCRVSVSVAAIGISDTLAQVPSALSDKIELAVRLMVSAAGVDGGT